ncbi:ABC-type amino acid transporter%2C membrane-spanning permease [Streptococcus pneumoniae]|nr:ABC-type amino acid transporter%2C membrane-spanning permease [Streptococcus pneumoniae]
MESILEILTPDNLVFIFKGFGLTLYISLIAIILSTIIGTVLAVMRNGKNPILRIISSIYIEFVHNVPNLLWIFTIFLVFKMKSTPAGITAFTLFTSAALAERSQCRRQGTIQSRNVTRLHLSPNPLLHHSPTSQPQNATSHHFSVCYRD